MLIRDIPTEVEIRQAAALFSRPARDRCGLDETTLHIDFCPCAGCEAERHLRALSLRDGQPIDTRAAIVYGANPTNP